MGQGSAHHGATGDGSIFAAHFLRGVVGIQSPAVLTGEALSRVLTHDLRSGDRLALRKSITIADVEDQASGLAHRLHTDQVVGDQLGVALPDERKGKPGEVSDVGSGGLIFEDHRPIFGVVVLELVLEDRGHQAELLGRHFTALREHRGPFLDEAVLLSLVKDLSLMKVGFFSDRSATGTSTLHQMAATLVDVTRRKHIKLQTLRGN